MPTNATRPALVPQTIVSTMLDGSVHFSCESGGEPLAVCVWERDITGRPEMLVIDGEVKEKSGHISNDISVFGGGLEEGKCGIRIHSAKEDDLGLWLCSLVTTGSHQVFSGKVDVRLEKRNCSRV